MAKDEKPKAAEPKPVTKKASGKHVDKVCKELGLSPFEHGLVKGQLQWMEGMETSKEEVEKALAEAKKIILR